jgi:hypothetical protein
MFEFILNRTVHNWVRVKEAIVLIAGAHCEVKNPQKTEASARAKQLQPTRTKENK